MDNGLRVLVLILGFFSLLAVLSLAEQLGKPKDAMTTCIQKCWTQACVMQCGEAVARASCR